VKAHIAARYSTEILALYESNQVPASRSDMARLMLLYAFGGFYVDAAMGFQQPLH
jgi:mannosyltransferase OCH1-like enzyme